jgi:hypothetical protein
MSGVAERLSEANQKGVEFLLVELDTAFTFIDVAGTANNPEAAERNYQHALNAYNVVLRFLPRVSLEAAQQAAIAEKLARLKTRLKAAGLQF